MKYQPINEASTNTKHLTRLIEWLIAVDYKKIRRIKINLTRRKSLNFRNLRKSQRENRGRRSHVQPERTI